MSQLEQEGTATISFQEEETYLFSSLVSHLHKESQKSPSITAKCFLAIFWKFQKNPDLYPSLLSELEKEIEQYNPDPSRASNRTSKIFVCIIYALLTDSASLKHTEKVQEYLLYASNSGDWLGQPRIACGVALLQESPLRADACAYLKENYLSWLGLGRDEFTAISLVALRKEISTGDLQKTCEHIRSTIGTIDIQFRSLYLIGISLCPLVTPQKNSIIDSLYYSISKDLKTADFSKIETEILGTIALALLLSKYHKISGFFERCSEDLKETLALKDQMVQRQKVYHNRLLILCILFILCIALINFIAFLPSWIELPQNPSGLERVLIAVNGKKWMLLSGSSLLIISIIYSYKKTGDPLPAIIAWIKKRLTLPKSGEKE